MDFKELSDRLDRIEQKQNYILGNQKSILEWQDAYDKRKLPYKKTTLKQFRRGIYLLIAINVLIGITLAFV